MSVWLRAIYPPLGVYATHDDLHFIQFASSFCRGESLGTYDQLTHAKGIFYPLFVLIKKTSGRLVSWLVLVVAFAMLNRLIHWTAVFVPLALMPLMILSLGFGWILSCLGAFVRHIEQVIGASVFVWRRFSWFQKTRKGFADVL